MTHAKSFSAGLAIAGAVFAVAYAALFVAYAGRPPAFLDHWFYRELVVWQTGLGAIIGLWGLALVAWWNFHKTRQRDKDLRDEEARAVATVIFREMLAIRQTCDSIHSLIATVPAEPAALDTAVYDWFKFPIVNVYEKLAPQLGILPPELIDVIGLVYGNLLNIQHMTDYFRGQDKVSRKLLADIAGRVDRVSGYIDDAVADLSKFTGFPVDTDVVVARAAAAREAVARERTGLVERPPEVAAADPPEQSA